MAIGFNITVYFMVIYRHADMPLIRIFNQLVSCKILMAHTEKEKNILMESCPRMEGGLEYKGE